MQNCCQAATLPFDLIFIWRPFGLELRPGLRAFQGAMSFEIAAPSFVVDPNLKQNLSNAEGTPDG